MIFTHALKRLCDFCFYMTFAAFLGALFGGDGLLLSLPFFTLTAYLSVRFGYIALLLMPASFLIIPLTLTNILVLLPPMVYMALSVPKTGGSLGRFDYTDIFSLFIKIFFGFLFFALILREQAAFQISAQPFGIIFLGASIILMRMTRHDDEILNQHRFKLLNTLSLLGMFAVGFTLSHPDFLTVARRVIVLTYQRALVPLILLILRVILWAINLIISLFNFAGFQTPTLDLDLGEVEFGEMDELELSGPEGEPSAVFEAVLYTALIIFIIIVLIILFKKLTQKFSPDLNHSGIEETRTKLTDPKAAAKKGSRTGNEIRDTYTKFLNYCQKNDIQISSSMTTQNIEEEAENSFHSPESKQLRELYIKARYGEAAVTKEDAKLAKSLYRSIRRAVAGKK